MNVDDGDEPRFEGFHEDCPQCGYELKPGMLGGGDVGMLISLTCLSCGYRALVDPFA